MLTSIQIKAFTMPSEWYSPTTS